MCVGCTEFEKRFEAVSNRFGARWVEKGKLVDLAKLQSQRLQDYRSQIGPANFGRREFRT